MSECKFFRLRHGIFGACWHPWGDVGRADDPGSCLRKLIAMRFSERGGFKREFLAIKGIPLHGIEHTVSVSPRNERFQGASPEGGGY